MTSVRDPVREPRRYDQPEGRQSRIGRHRVYVIFTIVVTMVVLFAVVEAVVGFPGLGVDSSTVRATAHGTTLEVRYAKATRGQLASPLQVTVHRDGGFDGPLTLAMSSDYLNLFITNDLSPSPSSETSTADEIVMTFDTPSRGDTLSVQWDLVAKPAPMFTTRKGTAAVLDESGTPVVSVQFETRVRV